MNSQLREAIEYLLDVTSPAAKLKGYDYTDIERARGIVSHLLKFTEK